MEWTPDQRSALASDVTLIREDALGGAHEHMS
jgi:hypothetical protein